MKLTGKILVSTVILAMATMLAGAIVSALPLSPPVSLPGESPSLPSMLFGSLVLVIGVVPIALGLGGRFATRWLALGLMLYVVTGVNTVIELSIFGTEGGHGYLLVFYSLCFVATPPLPGSMIRSNPPPSCRIWELGSGSRESRSRGCRSR